MSSLRGNVRPEFVGLKPLHELSFQKMTWLVL